jgi:hypothetical protein
MRTCKDHWQLMRDAVDARGMSSLVAKDGQTAMANELAQLEAAQAGDPEPHKAAPLDPLMSLHWHFANEALRCGGLYLMGQNDDGKNDGHFCPVCEFEKHAEGFVAKEAIGSVADQIADHCRAEGLIAKPN